MADSILTGDGLGPCHELSLLEGETDTYFHTMTCEDDYGELAGKPKGAELLAKERGLLKPGMLLPDMRTALSKCSDFANERPLVVKVLESFGQKIHFLPKYHCTNNAAEYV